jgi:thioredoxin 1
MEAPIHVTDAIFEETVLKSSLPVVVDFWARWCAPCRMVAPVLDGVAREYADRLVVAKVDIDENIQWATHFGIRSIPTLLFISGGKVVFEKVGAVPQGEMKRMVEQLLATSPAVQVQKSSAQ